MRWRQSVAMRSRRPKARCARLQIVSFENDLDSLRLAFRHDRDFPYLRHGGPAGILKRASGNRGSTPA